MTYFTKEELYFTSKYGENSTKRMEAAHRTADSFRIMHQNEDSIEKCKQNLIKERGKNEGKYFVIQAKIHWTMAESYH